MKLARPQEADSETIRVLGKTSNHCRTCQTYDSSPVRSLASLSSKNYFFPWDKLFIYLMILNGKAVLHVVDTVAWLSTATFLDAYGEIHGYSAEGTCLAFVEYCCSNTVESQTDWELARVPTLHQSALKSCIIHKESVAVFSYYITQFTRNWWMITRSFKMDFQIDQKDASQNWLKITLKLFVEAMNGTVGDTRLHSSRLVFNITPTLLIILVMW